MQKQRPNKRPDAEHPAFCIEPRAVSGAGITDYGWAEDSKPCAKISSGSVTDAAGSRHQLTS